jgi:[ribosomal protein S5]-alanine N-acetyltransferase
MALFRFSVAADETPVLRATGMLLRPPRMEDFPAWAALRAASRAFLAPWEPIWPADDLTRAAFRRRLLRYAQDMRDDAAYPLFLLRESDGALLGGLTLGQVRRGVSQTATLGYWVGQPYAGRGVMSTGVRAAMAYAFDELRLRRVEAACLPHNEASIRLLERIGFKREGYARKYLCINGSWQDHLLFALLREEFRPSP